VSDKVEAIRQEPISSLEGVVMRLQVGASGGEKVCVLGADA